MDPGALVVLGMTQWRCGELAPRLSERPEVPFLGSASNTLATTRPDFVVTIVATRSRFWTSEPTDSTTRAPGGRTIPW